VFPELKHSKDLRISGLDGWQDVDHQLQHAVFNGLLTYLRRYPQALIAPLMLQIQDSNGQPRRLSAEDFPDMPPQQLADLARTCLRPGAINPQWYAAGVGGYPYWHCELYPKDAQAETTRPSERPEIYGEGLQKRVVGLEPCIELRLPSEDE